MKLSLVALYNDHTPRKGAYVEAYLDLSDLDMEPEEFARRIMCPAYASARNQLKEGLWERADPSSR